MREAYASRGGVKFFCKAHPTPTLTAFASTLPLQGRVKKEREREKRACRKHKRVW